MAIANCQSENERARQQNGRSTSGKSVTHRRGASGREQAVPPITDHARERWAERAPDGTVDLETAWEQSIAVAAPARECDGSRLYAPYDLLFVLRGGVVTTVCPANYDSLTTDPLGQCAQCGNLDLYADGRAVCRWCGSRSDTVQMETGIVVEFVGGK